MPAILMRQQMRRKIIHEQDCHHEQVLVNIVVVVVQQKTSDLQFCHIPAILLQQENSQKKESQDLKFHDDTDNSANLEKSFTRLALALAFIERA
jgi:hypothetical protein